MSDDRVTVLFTDYDGTLAPVDVEPSKSAIPPALDSALRGIAHKSRVAVITAKSYDHIHHRMPYAWAWACVYGLDIRMSDGTMVTVSSPVDVTRAFDAAKDVVNDGVTLEEKRGPAGLLGFSVDWRRAHMTPDVMSLASAMEQAGMHVVYDPENPFVDFLCVPPRKDFALVCIRDAAESAGITMFLGDSVADNPAFRVADLAVAVAHGQRLDALACDFVTTRAELPPFLNALSGNDMRFEPGLPGLRRK